jgi:hypothetical protein
LYSFINKKMTGKQYFCEENKDIKYKLSYKEREGLYEIAQKYKNVNSIIIRKWLLRPYYVGDSADVKQIMRPMNNTSKIKEKIKSAEKKYILDNWIHNGVYTIGKKDIERLCE